MTRKPLAPLPIDDALPALCAALAGATRVVLEAPPGAGKTTRVPPALLDAAWRQDGRIVMLEPRRIAARMAAARIAAELDAGPVGGLVGRRMRDDAAVSAATRIEVVTEGVVVRMLQDDPSLDGVAALIFDEFHERSLDADLGLALALEAQAALRPDLRILVMSATLDAERIAAALGGAPVVRAPGRAWPVAIRWGERPPPGQPIEAAVAAVARAALAETKGGVLVFLPGGGEIRRTAALLKDRAPAGGLAGVDVRPLYGDLPGPAQDAAVAPPPPGRRKLVLATAIAETSLTLPDVRVVIDSGLARGPRFDPASGMTRLTTERASRAAAAQRAGRAGRVAPGVCYRLWREAEHGALPEFAPAEIMVADLAGLALNLAAWGAGADDLTFLDPPPAGALAQARDLLRQLGALDRDGRITPHGRALARAPLHPRLAHMALTSVAEGGGATACAIAALMEERDPAPTRAAAVGPRLDAIRRGADRWAPIRARARTLARRLRVPRPARAGAGMAGDVGMADDAGLAIARGWPDRVAMRRGGGDGGGGGGDGARGARYLLANGRGARLDPGDSLAGEAMLAVATVDGAGADARIRLAAPLDPAAFEAAFAEAIETRDRIDWDPRAEIVVAVRERRFGALVLAAAPLDAPDPEAVAAVLRAEIKRRGVAALPWPPAAQALRARVAFLRRAAPEAAPEEEWPDLGDDALTARLDDWLTPYLDGVTRWAALAELDLTAALAGLIDWPTRQRIDALAPESLDLPSGARAAIDYSGDAPRAAGRIQQFFGCATHPAAAQGRVPVVLELTSPAGRVQQVTADLPGFWKTSYAAVRADLRGRYPRHPWPEDPLSAEATNRAKPRRS